jgi:predicted ABC-class ATPase
MRDKKEFEQILKSIDGKESAAYAKLVGDFDFTRFVLHSLRIAPGADGVTDTLFVLHVPQLIAAFPPALFKSAIRRTALEDYLARKVAAAVDGLSRHRTTGGPRSILLPRPGAQILPRSSLIVAQDYVEARITVRLPVQNGLVQAAEATRIFFEDLPAIVTGALIYCYQDEEDLNRFVNVMEDADQIRQSLLKKGMVSFVGDGARLPGANVPPVSVPEENGVRVDVPNAGSLRGLGIPTGVTVIIGDPYSGRPELIRAISTGIYNHVPADGREYVITVPDAVEIVAEPSRPVQRVNISPFLSEGPGVKPAQFTTAAATPAESQMASLVEAVQVGAQVLIFDESCSAPAFLSADSRLAGLQPDAARRITPLSARARQIADELRVSLVIGAWATAAEFVPVADTVLYVANGRITNITQQAKASEAGAPARPPAKLPPLPSLSTRTRWIVPSSMDASLGQEDALVVADDAGHLRFGRYTINLAAVPQIVDVCQTATIGLLMYYAKLHYLDEGRTVAEVLDQLDQDLGTEGLDTLSRELRGDLARPRRYEIAAALNRLGNLRITQLTTPPAS